MDAMPAVPTVEDVRDALRDVIDSEFGLDIVEIGLVRDIGIQGGPIDVEITMTTPVARHRTTSSPASSAAGRVCPGVLEASRAGQRLSRGLR
jgi:Iron-sulfur cluster assembly protein